MSGTLIVGCGYIGTQLALELLDAGQKVYGLRRNPERLPERVEPVKADLSKPETLRELPKDVESVVYATAADAFEPAAYQQAYVDGLRHLLEALEEQQQKPRRILMLSSTGVFAQSSGEWVDEGSPAESTHFSGTALREGERLLRYSGHPAVVVRLGGIYGPGRTRLLDSVLENTARLSPEPSPFTNRIHRDDCAGVIRHLLKLSEPAGLYLGVDCEPTARNEVLKWIAEQVGVHLTQMDSEHKTTNRQRSNKRCINNRLLDSGYEFRFPTYQEGYGQLLAEHRA